MFRATARNRQGINEHASIPYPKALYCRQDREVFFGKTVRILVSPTLVDIESCLEMSLRCDTNPNAIGDELRVDIMRIIPDKVIEM